MAFWQLASAFVLPVAVVALMQDQIFDDVIVPADELPPGWREAVTLIAHRSRNMLVGHPWALSSLNQAQFGPNAVRHYEQSLAALASTTLSYPQKTEVTAILDDYVAGNASHTIEARERFRAAADNPGLLADAKAYGEELMATGKFPELEALASHAREAASNVAETGPAGNPDRQFETGLAALLDGIEQHYRIS